MLVTPVRCLNGGFWRWRPGISGPWLLPNPSWPWRCRWDGCPILWEWCCGSSPMKALARQLPTLRSRSSTCSGTLGISPGSKGEHLGIVLSQGCHCSPSLSGGKRKPLIHCLTLRAQLCSKKRAAGRGSAVRLGGASLSCTDVNLSFLPVALFCSS